MNGSSIQPLGPLFFEPVFKETIWGGTRLQSLLAKPLPPGAAVGESWEITAYGNEQSVIANGPLATMTLEQAIQSASERVMGTSSQGCDFPLLVKFIDANDKLSIQVHPNDIQAVTNGWDQRGKTECWYIADAKPGARIIVGLKEGVSLEDVKSGVRSNTLEQLLNFIDIQSGDVLFIPAGTVHAILDGTLVYEIQESSNCTLRLYDWGRVDGQGNPRQLHVEQSLAVLQTDYHQSHKISPLLIGSAPGVSHALRVVCRYFAMEEFALQPQASLSLPRRGGFSIASVMRGTVVVEADGQTVELKTGTTTLIPAALGACVLTTPDEALLMHAWEPDISADIIAPLRAQGIADSQIAALGGFAANNDILPLL